MNKALGSTMPT